MQQLPGIAEAYGSTIASNPSEHHNIVRRDWLKLWDAGVKRPWNRPMVTVTERWRRSVPVGTALVRRTPRPGITDARAGR